MTQQALNNFQLAAALSEISYRRNAIDLPIKIEDIAGIVSVDPLAGVFNSNPNLDRFHTAGIGNVDFDQTSHTRYFYTQRGFCAMVVETGGKYWVTFRGTDSAEGFVEGFRKGVGAPQNKLDPARKSDIGDWVNNMALAQGTRQESQLDDALALTQAVIDSLASGDTSKVVVAGQSMGGGLAGLVSVTDCRARGVCCKAVPGVAANASHMDRTAAA